LAGPRYLKEKNPRIRIVAADPMGAAMYSWIKRRELKAEGSSVTEGIGLGRVTQNVEGAQIDDAYQVPDAEALPWMFRLLKEEGLCVGGSSAINIAGAVRLARELGPGHAVVTILADSGTRYQSKLFNRAFLTRRGPAPDWRAARRGEAKKKNILPDGPRISPEAPSLAALAGLLFGNKPVHQIPGPLDGGIASGAGDKAPLESVFAGLERVRRFAPRFRPCQCPARLQGPRAAPLGDADNRGVLAGRGVCGRATRDNNQR
jgi:hypothetical protein